jgi:hypothetical protein
MSAAPAARREQAPAETANREYREAQAAEVEAALTGPVSNHSAAMDAGRESYPDGQRGQ